MTSGILQRGSIWAALLCGLCLTPCLAQTAYQIDNLVDAKMANPKSIEYRTARKNKGRLMTAAALDANARASIKQWYTDYAFPLMTDYNDLGRASQLRIDLLTEISRIRNAEVHREMVSQTLDRMKTVVDGNYHPLVKVNAMYAIAGLNDVESSFSARVPQPAAEALPYLLEKLNDAKSIDGIKVAALVGIHRHVMSLLAPTPPRSMNPTQRDAVVAALLTVAKTKDAPANRSKAGHAWMRGRAMEALAALGEVGRDKSIYATIVDAVGDEKAPPSLRCIASRSLGLLRYPANFDADLSTAARDIGALAASATRREIKRIEGLQRDIAKAASAASGGGASSFGGGPAGAEFGGGADAGGAGGGADPAGAGGGADPAGAGAGAGGGAGGGADPAGFGSGGFGSGGFGSGGAGSSLGLGGAAGGLTGPPGSAVSLPQFRIDNFKRRLRYQLRCVSMGIRGTGSAKLPGFKGVAQDPHKTVVDEVDKSVDAVLDAVNKNAPLEEILTELKKAVGSLETLTQKEKPAPPGDPGAAPAAAPSGDVPGDVPGAPAKAAPAKPAAKK